MSQRKKISKGKKPFKPSHKPRVKREQIKKKNEMMEKIKQDK